MNSSAESHRAAVQRWVSLQDGALIILGLSGLCLIALYKLSLLHVDIFFLGCAAGILIAFAYLFVYLKIMMAALFASLLTTSILAYTAASNLSVGLYLLMANGGLGIGLSLGVVALVTKLFSMGK